jgi:hypothetical protein
MRGRPEPVPQQGERQAPCEGSRAADHLEVSQGGVRYSGSCRSLTNRIPASRAAVLSALAARGIADSLSSDDAKVTVWTLGTDGSVSVVQRNGEPVTRAEIGAWHVSYDRGFLDQLSALRDEGLPNETGGAIVGIADFSRQALHLAHAFPQPEDSLGSPTRFERGVVGLAQSIDDVARQSMHQVRYLGEWHSHPRYANARPSNTDIAQLAFGRRARGGRVARPDGHRGPPRRLLATQLRPVALPAGRARPQVRHSPKARLSFGWKKRIRPKSDWLSQGAAPGRWHSI